MLVAAVVATTRHAEASLMVAEGLVAVGQETALMEQPILVAAVAVHQVTVALHRVVQVDLAL